MHVNQNYSVYTDLRRIVEETQVHIEDESLCTKLHQLYTSGIKVSH